MTRRVGLATVLCAALLTTTACGGNGAAARGGDRTQGVTGEEISYGLIYDQTGSTASSQIPLASGVKAYFEAVNRAGGVNGRTIEAVECDEKYTVADGVACLRRMISQTPVLGFHGLNFSSFKSAALSTVVENKIAMVGSSSTLLEAVNPYNGYIFETQCTYPTQADVAVAYGIKVTGKAHPRVAVLVGNAASGIAYADYVTERTEKAGGEVVSNIEYDVSLTNLDQQAQQIASTNPDFVVTWGAVGGTSAALRSLQKFNLSDIPIFGISPTMDASVPEAAPTAGKNFYPVTCYASAATTSDLPGLEAMIEDAKAAGYDEEIYENANFTHGYVIGKVTVEALKNAGETPTRESFAKAVAGVTNLSTGGLSPDISYGPEVGLGMKLAAPFRFDFDQKTWERIGDYEDYAECDSNEWITGNIDAWSPDCIAS